ncbi:MAG: phage holin family protein [Bacteroidota bacterium]
MDNQATPIETLFEKTEGYVKTTIDLFRLRAIDKSADVISTFVSKIAFVLIGFFILVILNIGLALWLGEVLGKSYYGFFVVSAFYALVAAILYFSHSQLFKKPVKESIIIQMMKEK